MGQVQGEKTNLCLFLKRWGGIIARKGTLCESAKCSKIQAQYGMDNDGNFSEQADAALMKAVSKGQITVKDYYEKEADLAATIR